MTPASLLQRPNTARSTRPAARSHFLPFLLAAAALSSTLATAQAKPKADPAAALLRTTNVWNTHFSFTTEQWKELEPKQREVERPAFGPGGMNLQGREGGRNGLSAAQGIEFGYAQADLTIDGTTLKKVGVRYKGNGTFMQSRGSDKRSLKVDVNHFDKALRFQGLTKLNFHNGVTDASLMNEVLSHRLYRDAGVPASRNAYSRVYVTVPGTHSHKYLGVYSVIENVDAQFADAHFGTRKGLLLKPVTPKPFEDLGDEWARYNQTYDPKSAPTPEQAKRIIAFCKLVSHASDAEFASQLASFVDLEEFARYMAVTVYLSTMDSILGVGQNYVVHLDPKSNKLQFIPWDLDHAFGQFPMIGSQDQREQLSISKPWQGEVRFLERVFKVDAFQSAYRARLAEFAKTIFNPQRIQRQVDELAAALREAVKEESPEKLERFDQVVRGETVSPAPFGGGPGGPGGPGRGGPGRPGGPMGFGAVKPIKAFVTARTPSIEQQLAGSNKGQVIERMFGPGARGGGFGPGMFLAPLFLGAADKNADQKASATEFNELATTWFGQWDKAKAGALTEAQLQEGLATLFPTPPDARPPGGPGGPGGGFNPAGFMARALLTALDQDKNERVTKEEFIGGFDRWFKAWNTKKDGFLDEEQMRSGMNQDLSPFRGGPPGGRGPGRP